MSNLMTQEDLDREWRRMFGGGVATLPPPARPMNRINLRRPLVSLDLETTGISYQYDRIVQYALITIRPDGTTSEISGLVDPGIPIPAEATAIHHITDAMVAGKKKLVDHAMAIRAALSGGVDVAGYNVRTFDLPFLQSEMETCGYPLNMKDVGVIDAFDVFKMLTPRSLADAVKRFCGAEHTRAHDATADASVVPAVLFGMLQEYRMLGKDCDGLETLGKISTPEGWDKWADPTGKLVFDADGDPCFNFGTHKDKKVKSVDLGYRRWVTNSDFHPTVKRLMEV